MDEIRERHGIRYKAWAKAAGLEQPRISELRRLSKEHRKGGANDVGRAFSIEKCAALIKGLMKLLGGAKVRKELIEKLQGSEDIQERLLILVLSLSEDQQESAELYFSALLGISKNNNKA